MYQYDNATAVPTWTPAAAGTPGYRTNGSPLGGPDASDLDADWDNTVDKELCNLVTGAGIALAKGTSTADLSMVIQAIRRIAGGNVTAITGSATLTPDNAGVVLISAAGGSIVPTLPAAASAGGQPFAFYLLRTDSSANTVNIALHSGDTWQPGALTTNYVMQPGELFVIKCDGISAWWVLRRASGVIVFETVGTATFTWPIGATSIEVELMGGGGGGQGSSSGAIGYPGAGGGYARKRIFGGVPGATVTVTVGAGGAAGGVGTGANGSNGGTSSFGSYCSATGGTGGTPSAAIAGGVGSGGDLNFIGGEGGPGGSGCFAPGGGGFSPGNAASGSFPGGGGGGPGQGATNTVGAGAQGCVVVRW